MSKFAMLPKCILLASLPLSVAEISKSKRGNLRGYITPSAASEELLEGNQRDMTSTAQKSKVDDDIAHIQAGIMFIDLQHDDISWAELNKSLKVFGDDDGLGELQDLISKLHKSGKLTKSNLTDLKAALKVLKAPILDEMAQGLRGRAEEAFFLAAAMGRENEVIWLLEDGVHHRVDDKCASEDNMTALHWAVQCGQAHVVRILLDKGASIDVKDLQGRTPFDLAVHEYFTQVSPYTCWAEVTESQIQEATQGELKEWMNIRNPREWRELAERIKPTDEKSMQRFKDLKDLDDKLTKVKKLAWDKEWSHKNLAETKY